MTPAPHGPNSGRELTAAMIDAPLFWKYVTKGEGCWVWTKASGRVHRWYGILNIKELRRPVRAHRASYALHYGAVPSGKLVRHTCDNPPCVNPAHLVLGTQADNLADMRARERGYWQVVHYCPEGHGVAPYEQCSVCAGKRDRAK